MRVALDWGPLLDPPTGVGRYTRELAVALEAAGVDVTRFAVGLRGRGTGPPGLARLRLPARLVQSSWRTTGMPPIARITGRVDVVHATNFVLPALGSVPGVVTVHDVSFLRDDTFPGGRRLRKLVPWSLERASRVLVPTEAVASDLVERFPVGRDRITVTPEGVSPLFFGATPLSGVALSRMGILGPFVLAVGTIEPRKNLSRLLKAWTAAADSLSGWTLVLAGPRGWGPELPPTRSVVPIGWVGDETLPGLLAAAELFCYPSLYEGFGLPPLEAMAAGTPALVGRYSAAEEVLGDAALLVDPRDEEALADALSTMVSDHSLRRQLALRGRARAVGYSWERTATATIGAYRKALVR
jgi:glycosyltransferase involved in cell wall biosynthesis